MNPLRSEHRFKSLENLPTLPGIAVKILEAVKDGKSSLEKIGEILSYDPPLSGKILGLINSAFYGLPAKVSTVAHAVRLLGLNTVTKVALSFSLLRLGKSAPKSDFNYPEFWRDSLVAAVAGRLMARRLIPELSEDAFTLGLLHEIGRLSLNQSLPKQYGLVLKECEEEFVDYFEAEDGILGLNHMELGSYLLRQWGLPESFCTAVQTHHLPALLEEGEGSALLLGRILFLAVLAAEYFSGEKKENTLAILAGQLKIWNYDQQLKVVDLLQETQAQAREVSGLFEIPVDSEMAYLDLIERARTELIQASDRFLDELQAQRKLIESLQKQVMLDSLTGLFTPGTLHYLITQEFQRARRYRTPLTLILGDIDQFKRVTDTYGQPAGDQVLLELAKKIKESLPNTDIIGRQGDEEFGILLPNTQIKDALATTERLRRLIESHPSYYRDQSLRITMCFGLAVFLPDSALSPDDLLRMADKALREAKSRGGNQIACFQGSLTGIRRRLGLVAA
jgi:two-component system cell cycle response regulator